MFGIIATCWNKEEKVLRNYTWNKEISNLANHFIREVGSKEKK